MKHCTFTRKESIRLRGFDYSANNIYFVTIVVRDRRRAFKNKELASRTVECLLELREKYSLRLYCYCLMPDHFHALIAPGESGKTLGQICGAFKSLSTRISWDWYEGKLWQRQYYDHIVRNSEDFCDCVEYVLDNPVEAGLVIERDQWPYSGRVDYLV